MKAERYRTHAIFNCNNCDKYWEDHNTAQRKARQHAKQAGHIVTGEVGTAYHYIGNSQRSATDKEK